MSSDTPVISPVKSVRNCVLISFKTTNSTDAGSAVTGQSLPVTTEEEKQLDDEPEKEKKTESNQEPEKAGLKLTQEQSQLDDQIHKETEHPPIKYPRLEDYLPSRLEDSADVESSTILIPEVVNTTAIESPKILTPVVVVTTEVGQANHKKRSRSPKSAKKVSSTALVYQLDTDNSKAASSASSVPGSQSSSTAQHESTYQQTTASEQDLEDGDVSDSSVFNPSQHVSKKPKVTAGPSSSASAASNAKKTAAAKKKKKKPVATTASKKASTPTSNYYSYADV